MTKAVLRVSLLMWLLAAGVAAQAQSLTIGYTNCLAVANYSQALMNQIGQSKWYFAHASVGECIMEGVTNLHLANPSFYQLQGIPSSSSPPGATQPGTIYDDDRGNPVYYGDYQVKLDLFNTAVRNGWHYPLVNMAMAKFCFVDIWYATSPSTVAAMLNSYLNTMTNLEAAFPQTVFVYATEPVTTLNYSYGTLDTEPTCDYWRNIYNNSLRTWCAANNRVLFDIADIEAHDTSGNLVTFTYNGLTCQELWFGNNLGGDQCCGEVGDGAHPTNFAAEQLLAKGFYAVAAALLNPVVGPSPVANNDSYSFTANTTLTVGAPGVLANDTDTAGYTLTAVLASGPANGTLTLNPNGGFIYTPATGFIGTDSFTYYAGDGTSNSTVATVSVVAATPKPVANNDGYNFTQNTTLTVGAPGVLANDTDTAGYTLTAVLASGPAHGTLTLNPNGGFIYTSATNFSATDSFTYYASDGTSNSAVATVTLTGQGAGVLFSDNLVRATDPGPLAPWVARTGTWTVTGGMLNGVGAAQSYGAVYVTNSWSNYTAQASIRFSKASAYAAGISGRLNPATGARYAAWVYPEGSPVGGPILKLIKFQSWTAWSYQGAAYTPIKQATLSGVSTNWHTLQLSFQGSQITVSYDGTQVLSVADAEASPYSSGAIGFDMYTDSTPYTFSADTVTVTGSVVVATPKPVAINDSYGFTANTPLTVGVPGVLANDTDTAGFTLTAVLASSPAHGTLTLNPNGGFIYTPAINFSGADSFTYYASDGTSNSTVATVTMVAAAPKPVANNDSYSFTANTTLTVGVPGVLANDTDTAGFTLTAVLASGPAHGTLTLNPNGGFIYTPATNFSAADSFTYYASDGVSNSAVATVALAGIATGMLFSDDFTRATNPGALTPWVAKTGTWTVAGGMLGGVGAGSSYGAVYVTNSWSNYTAQASIRFSTASAYGAGISGRLNPATGARYAAWVYPEGSPAGGPILKLIKFQSWTAWSYQGAAYTPIKQVTLSGVSTNWHTLQLSFQGSQITVSCDGTQVLSAADAEASPYSSGAIGFDMYTESTPHTFSVENVTVSH